MQSKSKTNETVRPRGKRVNEARSEEEETALYHRGLIARGEVAVRDKDGKLPPGATHEWVDGKIVRVRFSIV